MGDAESAHAAARQTFDPRETPVPRRRVLVLMGAGALAAGGGLSVLLEGCASPPVTVTLDVDPASLVVGTPTEVEFTLGSGGSSVPASAWLVKSATGEVTAFDPRCTHALCAYGWSETGRRFSCQCHEGSFALDGTVLAGPPPRPLDRFPARVVGDTIELDVPAAFVAPRESL
jgi:menaquinol-cytochrome c reductase iron-sulfur subunit